MSYGYTPTTPNAGMDDAIDCMQYGLMLMGVGASLKSDTPKSATPATETPCRCGVGPLPDEAYPFFNPHELHRATAEKGTE